MELIKKIDKLIEEYQLAKMEIEELKKINDKLKQERVELNKKLQEIEKLFK